MGHTVFFRNTNFGPRKGLEGPFVYPNGRVLYYDIKEGRYWDPLTDFFLEHDEVAELQQMVFAAIKEA
jgi:hypothetical protein